MPIRNGIIIPWALPGAAGSYSVSTTCYHELVPPLRNLPNTSSFNYSNLFVVLLYLIRNVFQSPFVQLNALTIVIEIISVITNGTENVQIIFLTVIEQNIKLYAKIHLAITMYKLVVIILSHSDLSFHKTTCTRTLIQHKRIHTSSL